MTHCLECKWWRPTDTSTFANLGHALGQCKSPAMWRETTRYNVDLKDFQPHSAMVEFDEEWGLLTGPEFGCALGENLK